MITRAKVWRFRTCSRGLGKSQVESTIGSNPHQRSSQIHERLEVEVFPIVSEAFELAPDPLDRVCLVQLFVLISPDPPIGLRRDHTLRADLLDLFHDLLAVAAPVPLVLGFSLAGFGGYSESIHIHDVDVAVFEFDHPVFLEIGEGPAYRHALRADHAG